MESVFSVQLLHIPEIRKSPSYLLGWSIKRMLRRWRLCERQHYLVPSFPLVCMLFQISLCVRKSAIGCVSS